MYSDTTRNFNAQVPNREVGLLDPSVEVEREVMERAAFEAFFNKAKAPLLLSK